MPKLKNHGFSLVEIILATTIASLAGVVLVTILFQNSSLYHAQSTKVRQGLNANDSSAKLSEAIKAASTVSATCVSCPIAYTTGTNTLVLALPSLDTQGSVLNNTYDYAVFSKDDTKPNILRKIVYPNASSYRKNENLVLATTLSSITFFYFDNSNHVVSPASATKINYIINLDQKAGFGNQVSSSSGIINLKNN